MTLLSIDAEPLKIAPALAGAVNLSRATDYHGSTRPIFTLAAVVATMMFTVCRSDYLGDIVKVHMFGKLITGSMIIAGILLFFILNSFSPNTGPGVILVVFFLLYIFCFGLITWLIILGNKLMNRLGGTFRSRRPMEPLKLSDAAYYSSIIAMAPVMVIAINSVGEVSIYDVGLVLLFVAIGAFYIKKRLG